jgi:hypothetical protein
MIRTFELYNSHIHTVKTKLIFDIIKVYLS